MKSFCSNGGQNFFSCSGSSDSAQREMRLKDLGLLGNNQKCSYFKSDKNKKQGSFFLSRDDSDSSSPSKGLHPKKKYGPFDSPSNDDSEYISKKHGSFNALSSDDDTETSSPPMMLKHKQKQKQLEKPKGFDIDTTYYLLGMRIILEKHLDFLELDDSAEGVLDVLQEIIDINSIFHNFFQMVTPQFRYLEQAMINLQRFKGNFDSTNPKNRDELVEMLKKFQIIVNRIIENSKLKLPENPKYSPVELVESKKKVGPTDSQKYKELAQQLSAAVENLEENIEKDMNSVLNLVKLILYFYKPAIMSYTKKSFLKKVKFYFTHIIKSLNMVKRYLERNMKKVNEKGMRMYVTIKCITIKHYLAGIMQFYMEHDVNDEVDEPKVEEEWKRAVEKYKAMQTDSSLSPIKNIETVLQPTIYKDDNRFQGLIWVLSMTEQFYYDNVLVILSKNRKKVRAIRNMLRLNYTKRDMQTLSRDWINVVPLGSGTFGDVIKVYDQVQEMNLAIKILKKSDNRSLYSNIHALMDYFVERNYLIKARESPYVVKFYQSIKIPKMSGLFLVFEFCIADLSKFLKVLKRFNNQPDFSESMWRLEDDVVLDNLADISDNIEMDVYPVIMVYILELFCSLDYLAKCSIVHNDIKPQNIMISENLHLKLGDFGLVVNQQFITARSKRFLLKNYDLDRIDDLNYDDGVGGTVIYMDVEELTKKFELINPMFFVYMRHHPDLAFKLNGQAGDFMSDVWSMGIVALELLLCGTHIFADFTDSGFDEIGCVKMVGKNVIIPILLTMIRYNFKRYIYSGLISVGGPVLQELMKFLASIFLPREHRVMGMRKRKEFLYYSEVRTHAHVDISKLEKLNVFYDMGIDSTNVFMYPINKNLKSILHSTDKSTDNTFEDYLTRNNYTEARNNAENFLPMQPGIDFTFH